MAASNAVPFFAPALPHTRPTPCPAGIIIKELAERGHTLSYRNSMLTEVLRPGEPSLSAYLCPPRPECPERTAPAASLRAALGGGSNEVTSSCNTLIIGCISPLALALQNTRATLE